MHISFLGGDHVDVKQRTIRVSSGDAVLQFDLRTRQGHILFMRNEYTWMMPLRQHPNVAHLHQGAYRPCIMTVEHASHVCDYLAPDLNASTNVVQVAKGVDKEEREFLHVLWAPFALVDKLREVCDGVTEREMREARTAFVRDSEGLEVGQLSGGGGRASSSGDYRECGFGALPGINRTSISVKGRGRNTPFSRSSQRSRVLEEAFGLVLNVASTLTDAACEGMLEREMHEACSKSPKLAKALQYPRVDSVLHWPTHQVAYRGAGLAHGATEMDRRRHALGVSDLHVDVMDGTTLGNANVYACFVDDANGVEDDVHDERVHVPDDNDVCVFPPVTCGSKMRVGGRGFQVRTMIPGWLCVMVFQTRTCLHGSVCCNDVSEFVDHQGQLAGRLGIRCIPYPLRPLLALIDAAEDSPDVVWELQRLALKRNDWYLLQRLKEQFPSLVK